MKQGGQFYPALQNYTQLLSFRLQVTQAVINTTQSKEMN
jgi:hypothetical protein